MVKQSKERFPLFNSMCRNAACAFAVSLIQREQSSHGYTDVRLVKSSWLGHDHI